MGTTGDLRRNTSKEVQQARVLTRGQVPVAKDCDAKYLPAELFLRAPQHQQR